MMMIQQRGHSKVHKINNQDRTQINGFRQEKFKFRREIGRNCFSNTVADEWNRLSDHIVSAETMLKKRQVYG